MMQEDKTEKFHNKFNVYLQSVIKSEGYITCNVDKRSISTKGGSYIGDLHEIDIQGKTEQGDKVTNIFVKHIGDIKTTLIYEVPDAYKREHFVYTDLIKVLYELQDEANVPSNDRYKIAKAFHASNEEIIVLENLTAKGFKTYFRMDVVNLEYAELAIKDLARFHALSFALQEKRPDYFNRKIKSIDCIYIFDDNWRGFTRNMFLNSIEFLSDSVKDKCRGRIADIVDKYPDYMRDDTCVKALCHGDYRHNNIMVKETEGKPTEVIAVDFQIVHLGNPVLDLLYFIFWGADREFRKKHLDYLKELYYDHLEQFLKYFDIQVEKVYSRREFEKQYKEKLDFGLMISVLYLPFLFPPEDEVPDFKEETSLDRLVVKVDDKFRERFRGIVDDFIEWGYL